jgi:hypothetical protein
VIVDQSRVFHVVEDRMTNELPAGWDSLRLSADGKTLSGPGRRWQRQDPLPAETFVTGFDRRQTATEDHLLRGWIPSAFNVVAGAEREYLAVLNGHPAAKETRHQSTLGLPLATWTRLQAASRRSISGAGMAAGASSGLWRFRN